jgi:hypothetical protein
VRRAAVLAACLASLALAAAPGSASAGSAVPDETRHEVVGGRHLTFAAHGDRIPPGSDARLRRLAKRLPTRLAAKLPATWCGTERSTDDSAHSSFSGSRFKVVYAYASDQPNRFAAYRDLIQDDVATVREWVIAASGGRKSIRFDTGTDCGPDYVDIAVIRLPQTRAFYQGTPYRADLVSQDVEARLLGMVGQWNTLIYADGLYANDGVTGTGMLVMDSRPGAVNQSNIGGATAMLWGHGGPDFGYERQTTFLHEATHNLGAVQDDAPHSTRAGHCFEMWDVMCYDDGGPAAGGLFTNPACPDAFPLPFECGGDDYFAVSPPTGSYLAGHWNVYDSAFLCVVSSCLTSSTTPAPTEPPPGTTPPPAPAPTTPTEPATPPDPGQSVDTGAEEWLDAFVADATARVKKVGLRGLAQGRAVSVRLAPPAGHTVQVDLLWGAAAIAGGSLDAAGAAKLKVPRVHRRLLAKKRKVRLVVQGAIRGAAGGGPPTLKRVAVTLKAPAKKKR